MIILRLALNAPFTRSVCSSQAFSQRRRGICWLHPQILYADVVLSSGTCMLQVVSERMTKDLTVRASSSLKIQVVGISSLWAPNVSLRGSVVPVHPFSHWIQRLHPQDFACQGRIVMSAPERMRQTPGKTKSPLRVGGEPKKTASPTLGGAARRRRLQERPSGCCWLAVSPGNRGSHTVRNGQEPQTPGGPIVALHI